MPHDAYPTDADLTEALQGLGTDPALLQTMASRISGAIAAAVEQWETSVAWHPYLADAEDSTRYFDPPTRPSGGGRVPGTKTLYLKGGLISLTSLTVSGTAFARDLDFYTRPDNAAVRGQAITEIDFLAPLYGLPRTIAVTGRWGRVTQIPDDVWIAILDYAKSQVLPEIWRQGAEIDKIKIGPIELTPGGTTTGAAQERLKQIGDYQAAFKAAIKRKKRMTL